jgi:hypothetical protein
VVTTLARTDDDYDERIFVGRAEFVVGSQPSTSGNRMALPALRSGALA